MPIRYYIDLDCGPRQLIGADELVALLARRERAKSIRQQFIEKYGIDDETKMRFREKTVTEDGENEKREISVADLRVECLELKRHRPGCIDCPAAIDATAYSCVQAITLPISKNAEQWLVDRIAPADSGALQLFLDACSQGQYGRHPLLERWRAAGFFEARKCIRGKRAGLLVTSDQVLHEMFLVGNLMPIHILGVLIHLDALVASDGRRGDDLLSLLQSVDESSSTADTPMIDIGLHPEDGDDLSIQELKQFLFAAFRAFSLQVPLAIKI